MRIYARKRFLAFLSMTGFVLGMSGCASTSTSPHEFTKTERAQRLVAVANGAIAENDPTAALQYVQQAETLDAKLPELHHAKALALVLKHENTAAIEAVKKALVLKSDYAEANNTLGRLYLEAGRYREAIPYLQSAASNLIYRESYKADINLGILYYRTGQDALAKKYFDHAILLVPNLACIAYYYRGHLDLRAEKPRDAVEQYEKATHRFCARFADAHLALGMALAKDHQYARARKKLLDVYKIFPESQIARQAMEQLKQLP